MMIGLVDDNIVRYDMSFSDPSAQLLPTLDEDTNDVTLAAEIDTREVSPSPDIFITTVTAHTTLQTKINLLAISHYLHHYTSEWPEIAWVKSNFGRQIDPDTEKRVFYFATWFGLVSQVDRPHRLCIRFNGNGAVHVVGIINPAIEYEWLEDWLRRFLRAVDNTEVPCKASIQQRPEFHNLWACSEGYIWSPQTKVPIGWAPMPTTPQEKTCGNQLVLSGKPVILRDHSNNEKLVDTNEGEDVKVYFRTIKGNPMLYFDQLGHQVAIDNESYTKPIRGKRKHSVEETIEMAKFTPLPLNTILLDKTDLDWSTSVQSITDEHLNLNNLQLKWKTACINAKCSLARIRDTSSTRESYINWLDRDKFRDFVKEHYDNLMVNFDPEVHKAVQVTFFIEQRNELGRLEAKGSVSVTRTGLFWLYGFQEMEFANQAADMISKVILAFRNICLVQ